MPKCSHCTSQNLSRQTWTRRAAAGAAEIVEASLDDGGVVRCLRFAGDHDSVFQSETTFCSAVCTHPCAGTVVFRSHQAMLQGLCFLSTPTISDGGRGRLMSGSLAGPTRVLLAGLGGGGLARHILSAQPAWVVDAVEVSGAVVDLAREWMGIEGLVASGAIRIIQEDVMEFVKRGISKPAPYAVAIVDINDPAGFSPALSLDGGFWSSLRELVSSQGVVVINVLHRPPGTLQILVEQLWDNFASLYFWDCYEENGEVLFALPVSRDDAGIVECLGRNQQILRDRWWWLDEPARIDVTRVFNNGRQGAPALRSRRGPA